VGCASADGSKYCGGGAKVDKKMKEEWNIKKIDSSLPCHGSIIPLFHRSNPF